MIANIDISVVDWSRAQFALTAMFHWIFVPLTLGLTFIISIMESIYVKTENPEWKRITQFWMKLFGVNFAIGIATGLILEFEFGTNWSNYSWFVGDIFGAPLAIEGIMAFFLESTFIAVMFFGWEKVNKRFHLISTWLVAIGANLSALWILVANGWMQDPRGVQFNPVTVRNEMISFLDIVLSPTSVDEFVHTLYSSYLLSAIFVIGISAWFLLKRREQFLACRSIVIAAIFGILTSTFTIITGDISARRVASVQPMKLAAFEGVYNGKRNANLIMVGIPVNCRSNIDKRVEGTFYLKLEVPGLLSYLAYGNMHAFVPGIYDLLNGNREQRIMGVYDKISRGKIAINKLKEYKDAMKERNIPKMAALNAEFKDVNFINQCVRYLGYGYIDNPSDLVPNIPLIFYSFRIMVGLGFYFVCFFIVMLGIILKKKTIRNQWLLHLAIFTIPLAYLASQCGWIVTELGRQPWAIQDLMPTMVAASDITTESVKITFWLFAFIFTTLLIAELRIMFRQVSIGPSKNGEESHV